MKFYDSQEASETLSAITTTYGMRTVSEALSELAIRSLKNDGSITFKEFDGLTLIRQNGKYAIKLPGEN
jgi:hypothetical protein